MRYSSSCLVHLSPFLQDLVADQLQGLINNSKAVLDTFSLQSGTTQYQCGVSTDSKLVKRCIRTAIPVCLLQERSPSSSEPATYIHLLVLCPTQAFRKLPMWCAIVESTQELSCRSAVRFGTCRHNSIVVNLPPYHTRPSGQGEAKILTWTPVTNS